MPSLRLGLLTAFCFSMGSANGESEVLPEAGYTFESLKARILDGPNALSIFDRLLYFAVLAVALEVFNYVSIRLGGM